MVESFFGSLKQERVQWCSYQTRDETQQDVLKDISMFYTRDCAILATLLFNGIRREELTKMKVTDL